MSDILTSLPNASMPCVTTNPCTCPVYGPGGSYQPVQAPDFSWYCALALEGPGATVPSPVPTLSEWAIAVLAITLAIAGARRLR